MIPMTGENWTENLIYDDGGKPIYDPRHEVIEHIGITNIADAIGPEYVREMLDEFVQHRNRTILRVGEIAVENGDVTRENVERLTRDTYQRHLLLMRDTKYELTHERKGDKEIARLTGNPARVKSFGDMSITVLRQKLWLPARSTKFRELLATQGKKAAFQQMSTPRTPRIYMFNTDRIGQQGPIQKVFLDPNGLESTDEVFMRKWAKDFTPFSRPEFNPLVERTDDESCNSDDMTPGQLIVAAGLLHRFNAMLHLIEVERIEEPSTTPALLVRRYRQLNR